jgi:hypothetical protein
MEPETPQVATLDVRCRRCAKCKRHRARLWAARARDETASSERTWFGTLTLSADNALRVRFAAERDLAKRGWQSAEIEARTFDEMVRILGHEITLFLKRVRKNSEARIRYIFVSEMHTGGGAHHGMVHFHCLIHENSGSVSKRCLEAAWRHGFSQFRLVDKQDTRTPYYVTKYLTKADTSARMRASTQYGRNTLRNISERMDLAVHEVKRCVPSPEAGTQQRDHPL